MRHLLGSLSAAALVAAAAGAQPASPAIHARVFGDFNYTDTQRPQTEGFRLGQVAGHLTWALSDRVTFFSEATATGQTAGYMLEVERLLLRYDYRDWLKLSGGRVHTPISYWNTTFHHGQWMQTTIGRPEMIRGGNALVPIHFVGLTAEGSLPAGPVVFGYTVGAGNGRGTTITRAGDGGDANNSRATVASATARLPHFGGLRLGGGIYNDRLTPTAGIDVTERILSGHLALERESPEVIVEYARIRHTPVGAAPLNSATSYAQLGYRLSGRLAAWKPYARVDRSRIPANDPVLAPLRLNFDAVTGGVRYDLASIAALKVEYRGERIERAATQRTIAASLSFTFPGKAEAHHDEPMIMDDTPAASTAAAADSAKGPKGSQPR